jgi:hypothetical protein
VIDLSKFLQKSSRTATLGLKMITLSELNDYVPTAITVFVIAFIVTASRLSRELGGISVMIKEVKDDVSEVKDDVSKVKAEVKEELGGIKADLNLFKFGSAFIFALGIGGALNQFYQARGS